MAFNFETYRINDFKLTGFGIFLSRVNKYKERYDIVFEKNTYDEFPVTRPYDEIKRYKVYDKYSPKPILEQNHLNDLNSREGQYIVRLMNRDELIYLRQIYQYCYENEDNDDLLWADTQLKTKEILITTNFAYL